MQLNIMKGNLSARNNIRPQPRASHKVLLYHNITVNDNIALEKNTRVWCEFIIPYCAYHNLFTLSTNLSILRKNQQI